MYQKRRQLPFMFFICAREHQLQRPALWTPVLAEHSNVMKWLSGVPCLLNQQGQARAGLWVIQDAVMLHSQRKPGTLSMQVKQIHQEACLPAVFCCNGLYSRQFQQKCHVSAHHTITGGSICFTASGRLPSREGVGGPHFCSLQLGPHPSFTFEASSSKCLCKHIH